MTTHELKVIPPYFDALVSTTKTFELRKNDRAYQRGDILKLREWHPLGSITKGNCVEPGCSHYGYEAHYPCPLREHVEREITFVYAGDPRFEGLQPGYVILGLATANPRAAK